MAMYTCKMLTESLTKYFANACIHRLKEMWKDGTMKKSYEVLHFLLKWMHNFRYKVKNSISFMFWGRG